MKTVIAVKRPALWMRSAKKGKLGRMETRMESLRTGAAVQAGDRPSDYYRQARPEVAELVPADCHRVLEVGCAGGELGRLLRSRGHHVTGIELVPEMAEQARRWLDRVVTADVERDGFPFPPASFDAIIFADVLEHLVDPWRVLREAVAVLADGGVVVASIPNVQNLDVIRRLLRGRWDYRERGILDCGHLRFFTLHSIRTLFGQAGLTLEHIGHRYRRSWWRELLCWLSAGRARGLWTRQYLVVGRKPASAGRSAKGCLLP
jgi:SAM-dependent methyltransferase